VSNAPNMVIARFRNGTLVKGTTINFRADAQFFHIDPPDAPYGEGTRIPIRELKAIFFVKRLEGNPDYKERKAFARAPGFGRPVRVVFADGEELVGVLQQALDRKKPGFFLYPADPESNNERIFALFEAVLNVEVLDEGRLPMTDAADLAPPTPYPPSKAIDPWAEDARASL